MKNWLIIIFLAVPALAWSESDVEVKAEEAIVGRGAAEPQAGAEPTANWVDSSYNYATDQTQALTLWMDSFFGDPTYELEEAESLVRLRWINEWDQDDDYSDNWKLRGKLQLPRFSKRLNLVFNDEKNELLEPGQSDTKLDDSVGLVYEVSEDKTSRIDFTMGISLNHLRPGVRYRYQDAINAVTNYRFTQRLQYETSEGAYTTAQLELNRALSENNILRWKNRGIWGEQTDGLEWQSTISLFQRRQQRKFETGISYFGAIDGVTSPDSYVRNYRVGVLFRRQVYRKYLFVELEPAYNYRKRLPEDNRDFAWSIALTFEIALERDWQRSRSNRDTAEQEQDATAPDQSEASSNSAAPPPPVTAH